MIDKDFEIQSECWTKCNNCGGQGVSPNDNGNGDVLCEICGGDCGFLNKVIYDGTAKSVNDIIDLIGSQGVLNAVADLGKVLIRGEFYPIGTTVKVKEKVILITTPNGEKRYISE